MHHTHLPFHLRGRRSVKGPVTVFENKKQTFSQLQFQSSDICGSRWVTVVGKQGFARIRAEVPRQCWPRGLGASGVSHSHWAFLPIPTRAPGSPAGPHGLKPSLGSAWAGPAPPRPIPREEAALKTMRWSAGLSGSGVSLGFHPPKQAAGRRGLPAAASNELRALLGSHAFPRPVSPQ